MSTATAAVSIDWRRHSRVVTKPRHTYVDREGAPALDGGNHVIILVYQ